MMIDDRILAVAEDVTFQSMGPGEQTVVLSLTTGELYTCNETAEEFLKALDGRRTFAQIVGELLSRFEVDAPRLEADLTQLADQMLAERMIVVKSPPGQPGG